jgi:hypothetical protein
MDAYKGSQLNLSAPAPRESEVNLVLGLRETGKLDRGGIIQQLLEIEVLQLSLVKWHGSILRVDQELYTKCYEISLPLLGLQSSGR